VTSMWGYGIVEPTAAFIAAIVLYATERGPVVGSRWLKFLAELDNYRRNRRAR